MRGIMRALLTGGWLGALERLAAGHGGGGRLPHAMQAVLVWCSSNSKWLNNVTWKTWDIPTALCALFLPIAISSQQAYHPERNPGRTAAHNIVRPVRSPSTWSVWYILIQANASVIRTGVIELK